MIIITIIKCINYSSSNFKDKFEKTSQPMRVLNIFQLKLYINF